MYASLRSTGTRPDLGLIVADEPAVVGGTFTQNVMCAAPVTYCKQVRARRQIRVVGACVCVCVCVSRALVKRKRRLARYGSLPAGSVSPVGGILAVSVCAPR